MPDDNGGPPPKAGGGTGNFLLQKTGPLPNYAWGGIGLLLALGVAFYLNKKNGTSATSATPGGGTTDNAPGTGLVPSVIQENFAGGSSSPPVVATAPNGAPLGSPASGTNGGGLDLSVTPQSNFADLFAGVEGVPPGQNPLNVTVTNKQGKTVWAGVTSAANGGHLKITPLTPGFQYNVHVVGPGINTTKMITMKGTTKKAVVAKPKAPAKTSSTTERED